jgi:glycosyltransferase involved in cell wall biosynthesis
MRILVVTHYYSTHGGGIEIVAGALAAELRSAHELTWVASDCDPTPPGFGGMVRFVPMRSTNFIERLTGLPFPIWGPLSLFRLWRETRDADVVHLHDFSYLGNWAAFVFARIRGRPVCITQHVGFIPYRSAALRAILRGTHLTLGRFMLGRAGQTVFVSRIVREYFERIVRFRRLPLVIANGVDTSMFVPRSMADLPPLRAAIGVDLSRPVLLFVGRFVEKKGLHVLEALSRRFPEVSWILAGWGPIDPRTWKAPNVQVFEGLRGATLVPLYQAADLLVLPSVGEGLPLVAQEAMSCGTPVLVGNDTAQAIGAPADIVFSRPVGGARTIEEWEEAIRTLIADRDALSAIRPAVAGFARQSWSWTACARSYSTVFEDLVG